MGNEKKLLSIIICTYNREKLLRQVVESLVEQVNAHPACELIIVDNNSSDETAQVAKSFNNKIESFNYYFEAEQGLSSAINRGLKEAKEDCVGYIDYYYLTQPNWIQNALRVAETILSGLFGGLYTPWYEKPKLKWLDASYGAMARSDSQKYLDSNFLSGGKFFKRDAIDEFCGFDPVLEMKGNALVFAHSFYTLSDWAEISYKLTDLYDPKAERCIVWDDPELKIDWPISKGELPLLSKKDEAGCLFSEAEMYA